MYYVEQSGPFEAIAEVGITGLVGTISLQILDNQGAVVSAASTAGIIESPAGSGFYQATRTAPGTQGQFSIVWSEDGSFAEGHVFADDLVVVAAGAADEFPPIGDLEDGPGPVPGPCNAWASEELVAACCDAEVGSDYSVYEDAIVAASTLLWELSGRLFSGTCDRTVRPCRTRGCGGWQVLSRGYVIEWGGHSWINDLGRTTCGCRALSRIKLSGYPVREIIEVKIDGDVVSDSTYRLDEWHYLTRKDGLFWPSCQDLSVDDTEDGSFSVRYTYGQNPPQSGQDAAAELACEIYKSCVGVECALPQGATRITRQGVVVEKLTFAAFGRQQGIWRTSLGNVDAFLNAYNPIGVRRRPAFWGPKSDLQYARPVGGE